MQGLQKKAEKQIKVCLLGDAGVGKSCIASRFVQDTFKDIMDATVGASYISKVVELETISYKVQIWDTAGQEQYRSLAPMYYRGAAAAILVFDISYEKSFLNISKWIEELTDIGTKEMLLVLVGNKSDLADQRTVPESDIENYAREHGIEYFETSAKTGDNVENTFLHVCRNVPESLIRSSPLPPRHIRLSDSSETLKRRKKCC